MVGDKTPVGNRPDRDPGFTDDSFFTQRPAATGVAAVAAVIAHDEIFTFRDNTAVVISDRRVGDVGFIQNHHRSVLLFDGNDAVLDMNRLAGHADDTLYVVVCYYLEGRVKNDDVTAFRLVKVINQLIDDKLFAGMKGIIHTRPFDDEFLNDSLKSEYDNGRDNYDRYCVAKKYFQALFVSLALLVFGLLHIHTDFNYTLLDLVLPVGHKGFTVLLKYGRPVTDVTSKGFARLFHCIFSVPDARMTVYGLHETGTITGTTGVGASQS